VAVLVGLLGPLVITGDDGAQIALPAAPKVRAVLERLALQAGSVVQTWELVDAVWADDPPRSAPNALSVYVAELRRCLPAGTIRRDAGGYSLNVSSEDVDATRFDRLVHEGSGAVDAGDFALAVASLRQALDLWRGEPLVEVAGRTVAESTRLSELRLLARESLDEARLQLGEHRQIIADLEAAVSEEPLRERRWAQLILALYRCDRQADALATYQRMRSLLAEQLGLEPSQPLVDLERAILVHDPSLELSLAERTRLRGSRAGNLPASVSSFVGRDQEAEQIRALLHRRRLVTLTGEGGSGKTRLAVYVATQISDEFCDGAWFVDLAPAGDDDVPAAFAASLGLQHSTEQPLIEALIDYVAGQHLLIVADNCEHVIARAAQMIDRLLTAEPNLVVLATSREPLHITGEAVWRLEPLQLPAPNDSPDAILESEAVQLFVERARDVAPKLNLDNQSVGVIAEIATVLDGLPLALELAAALAGMVSLSEIRDQLDASVSLLTRGPRTASPRHQTLAAALDWSYRLLTPIEQATLRRLSIFAGSFILDAVRPVVSLPGLEVEDSTSPVWRLCAKSLVVAPNPPEPNGRFRLLETTRQFAYEQLVASGEQPAAESAFIDFYVTSTCDAESALCGPNQAGALSDLRADHDNLRRVLHLLSSESGDTESALKMLVALQRYWIFRGDLAEWLDFAVPLTVDKGAHLRRGLKARALAAQCFLGSSLDPARAREWGRTSLSIAKRAKDSRAQCEALIALAVNGLLSGLVDPSPAEQALLLARQIGDPVLIGEALTAVTFIRGPDLGRVARRTEEAINFLRGSGDHLFEVFALNNLGVLYEEADDLPQATVYFEIATELAGEIGYGFPIGLANLAELRIRQGHPDGAIDPLTTALRLGRQSSPRELLLTIRVIARHSAAHGDYRRAAQLQGHFRSAWSRAGFEPSILTDHFAEETNSLLERSLGDALEPLLAEGSSLTVPQAVELADTVTRAVPV
jgi:predicted ATPase/DNA-binding SARP family transcriptional activator